MPALTLLEQTALDTLVISQITEIRKMESTLQKRLGGFSTCDQSDSGFDCREELLQLQQRADRLSRLINAMGGYSNQFV